MQKIDVQTVRRDTPKRTVPLDLSGMIMTVNFLPAKTRAPSTRFKIDYITINQTLTLRYINFHMDIPPPYVIIKIRYHPTRNFVNDLFLID